MKWGFGQRIRLLANKAEGWDEQAAWYGEDEGNGCHIVYVEPMDRYDDGIREVTTEQIADEHNRQN